jgi:hypothetical protein
MHGEMPGFFPGRPGGEHDEPLLDMLLERRPIPPGAPPEMHDLARMLAAAAGPAESGELAGEVAAMAVFARRSSPPGISPAVSRSARRRLSGWSARGRAPLAAAVTVLTAGLGSTAAAYADVLPTPIQQFAHDTIAAPAPSGASHPSTASAASPQPSAGRQPGGAGRRQDHPAPSALAPGRGASQGPRDRQQGLDHGRKTGRNVPSCYPGHGLPQKPTPSPTKTPAPQGSGSYTWTPPSPSPQATDCVVLTTPAQPKTARPMR